jgi:hypothetical protein
VKIRHVKRTMTVLAVAALALTRPAAAFADRGQPARHNPDIATEWASAWSGTDPQALAMLFTSDATYTDLALNVISTGRTGIAAWKQGTDQLISGVHVTIVESFRSFNGHKH